MSTALVNLPPELAAALAEIRPLKTVSDLREESRTEGYVRRSASELSFDPKLAFELALEMSDARQTFAKYGVSEDAAVELCQFEPFKQKLREYRDEILKSGISFRLKAKLQAEDLLRMSYLLATDAEVPAAVRADMIKWTAKMADLEPATKDGKNGGGGAMPFQLNILFRGGPGETLVSVAPALEQAPEGE